MLFTYYWPDGFVFLSVLIKALSFGAKGFISTRRFFGGGVLVFVYHCASFVKCVFEMCLKIIRV